MLYNISNKQLVWDLGVLTKAEHYIKEYDQKHGDSIDGETYGTHPEGALWNVFPSCDEM